MLTLRTTLASGNSNNEKDKNTEILDENSALNETSQYSNTVYINDSYNLDTIPLQIDDIVDIDNCENPTRSKFRHECKNPKFEGL